VNKSAVKQQQSVFEQNKELNYENSKLYLDFANSRLKIIGLPNVASNIAQKRLEKLKDYAADLNLGKVLCNCLKRDQKTFLACGFKEEGRIDGFFEGEDAYCMSFFTLREREISKDQQKKDEIINSCLKSHQKLNFEIDKSMTIRKAQKGDIPQIKSLLENIFKTYPSPIFDECYLENIMDETTMFMVVERKGEIISVASAQMDFKNKNAEITDCATNPEFRGKGLLTQLISQLEATLIENNFKTLYSLSRAIEPGINKALRKMHYVYRGRLINNCNISGGFEDMNIWVKKINA
jgi:putative beta-lysine N-acetyltransferase